MLGVFMWVWVLMCKHCPHSFHRPLLHLLQHGFPHLVSPSILYSTPTPLHSMFALINKLIPNTSATPPNQQAVSIFSLSLCLPQTQFHKRALKHKQPIAALHYTHKTLQLHVSVSLNTNEIRNSLSLSLSHTVRSKKPVSFNQQDETRRPPTPILFTSGHSK